MLRKKLGLEPKFAKAITEVRKKETWFNNYPSFERKLTKYYENRNDKSILNSGLDIVFNLVNSSQPKIVF